VTAGRLTTSIPQGKGSGSPFRKKKDAEAELAKRVSLIAEKRYLDEVQRGQTKTIARCTEIAPMPIAVSSRKYGTSTSFLGSFFPF
jgi:hypothetical protein